MPPPSLNPEAVRGAAATQDRLLKRATLEELHLLAECLKLLQSPSSPGFARGTLFLRELQDALAKLENHTFSKAEETESSSILNSTKREMNRRIEETKTALPLLAEAKLLETTRQVVRDFPNLKLWPQEAIDFLKFSASSEGKPSLEAESFSDSPNAIRLAKQLSWFWFKRNVNASSITRSQYSKVQKLFVKYQAASPSSASPLDEIQAGVNRALDQQTKNLLDSSQKWLYVGGSRHHSRPQPELLDFYAPTGAGMIPCALALWIKLSSPGHKIHIIEVEDQVSASTLEAVQVLFKPDQDGPYKDLQTAFEAASVL